MKTRDPHENLGAHIFIRIKWANASKFIQEHQQ